MKTILLQKRILSEIKNQIPSNKNISDIITDILSLSKAAAYKRLNGETALTLEDLRKLSQHFKFSVDNFLFEDSEMVNIDFPQIKKSIKSFEDTLTPLIKDFSKIDTETSSILVSTLSNEIPIFHFFLFEELISFKVFCWGKSIWKLKEFRTLKFTTSLIKSFPNTLNRTKELQKKYYSIPSLEIWGNNAIRKTLKQIEYFLESNLFEHPLESLVLCEKLHKMVEHLKDMVECGRKFSLNSVPEEGSPKFSISSNEIININSTILVEHPNQETLFFAFDNPNYSKTSSPKLCTYKKKWVKKVLENSQGLGKGNEKNRNSYFNHLTRMINVFEQKFKTIIQNKEILEDTI